MSAPLPAYSGSNFACLVERTKAKIARMKASKIPTIARMNAQRIPHSPKIQYGEKIRMENNWGKEAKE